MQASLFVSSPIFAHFIVINLLTSRPESLALVGPKEKQLENCNFSGKMQPEISAEAQAKKYPTQITNFLMCLFFLRFIFGLVRWFIWFGAIKDNG